MGERLESLLSGVYAKPTKHKKYHVFHYSIVPRCSLAFFDNFIKFSRRKDKSFIRNLHKTGALGGPKGERAGFYIHFTDGG